MHDDGLSSGFDGRTLPLEKPVETGASRSPISPWGIVGAAAAMGFGIVIHPVLISMVPVVEKKLHVK